MTSGGQGKKEEITKEEFPDEAKKLDLEGILRQPLEQRVSDKRPSWIIKLTSLPLWVLVLILVGFLLVSLPKAIAQLLIKGLILIIGLVIIAVVVAAYSLLSSPSESESESEKVIRKYIKICREKISDFWQRVERLSHLLDE